jgi:hypothetical protein
VTKFTKALWKRIASSVRISVSPEWNFLRANGRCLGNRALPAASARDPGARTQLENTRARILQILQLDKENEQLLLRCSLNGARPSPSGVPAASVTMLQKIYARCS